MIAVIGFALGKNDDRWLATWGGAGVGIILGLSYPDRVTRNQPARARSAD